MGFTKKTWKNRNSQNPLRRRLTRVDTGTSQVYDIEREEGTVTEAGDDFSAENMNDLETRVDNAFTEMRQTFQDGVDAVYNACVALGIQPSASTPTAIATAISTAAQEKTITASRSEQVVTPDDNKLLSKVTVNKYPDATGTYTASSRGASLDMGATNNYRYVNTNSVPNSNSGTFTPSTNSTAHDMGATNSYRYVNTNTVYTSGYNSGKSAEFAISVNTYKTSSTVSTDFYNTATGQKLCGFTVAANVVWKQLYVSSGGSCYLG